MKRLTVSLAAIILILASSALMVWMYQAAGPGKVSSKVEKPPGTVKPATKARSKGTPLGEVVIAEPAAIPEPVKVSLLPDKVLAIVNKQSIQLRDLMPVGAAEEKQTLTSEEYQSRLARAINATLVFQEAKTKGMDLTEAQQKRLESIVGSNEAEMEHYKKYGLTWKSTTAEHEEFEKRMLTAQMLEQNLVNQQNPVLTPSTDPTIQSLYEQARQQFLAQLHEQAKIEVNDPALAAAPAPAKP